jgi:hypothetical protein
MERVTHKDQACQEDPVKADRSFNTALVIFDY